MGILDNNQRKHLKKWPRLIILFSLAGMTLVSAIGCSTNRAIRLRNKDLKEWGIYQWSKDKKNSDTITGWTIYSRKVKGSKFKEFKITGKISVTSPEVIRRLLEKSETSKSPGSWKFEPFGNQSSKAIYIVYADSGRKISPRLANANTRKGLVKKLRSIEMIIQKLK